MFASKRINPKNKNITIIGVGETGQGAAILAKKLGAVNTLVLNQNDGWSGMNTDVEGFLAPLKDKDWGMANA